MNDRIIKKPELIKRVGMSYPTIWRMVKDHKFPPPVQLGGRRIGWRESDINKWIAGLDTPDMYK